MQYSLSDPGRTPAGIVELFEHLLGAIALLELRAPMGTCLGQYVTQQSTLYHAGVNEKIDGNMGEKR